MVGSIRQDHFCVFAVKPGQGELKDDQRVWQFSTGIGHVPSPILVGKELYVVSDGGVAACLDALNGKELWRERLGGNQDASPIEIRGRIYFCNREGKTTVIAASRQFKKLASNQLKRGFQSLTGHCRWRIVPAKRHPPVPHREASGLEPVSF